jgi:hypothetical protein
MTAWCGWQDWNLTCYCICKASACCRCNGTWIIIIIIIIIIINAGTSASLWNTVELQPDYMALDPLRRENCGNIKSNNRTVLTTGVRWATWVAAVVHRHAIAVVRRSWRAFHQDAVYDATNAAAAQLAMGRWRYRRVVQVGVAIDETVTCKHETVLTVSWETVHNYSQESSWSCIW